MPLDDATIAKVVSRAKAAAYTGVDGIQLDVLFRRADKNHNGDMEFDEFKVALRRTLKVGRSIITDEEMHKWFRHIDTSNNGTVSVDEFVEWVEHHSRALPDRSAKVYTTADYPDYYERMEKNMEKLQARIWEKRDLRDEEEVADCTFQPHIPRGKTRPRKDADEDIWSSLYKRGLQKEESRKELFFNEWAPAASPTSPTSADGSPAQAPKGKPEWPMSSTSAGDRGVGMSTFAAALISDPFRGKSVSMKCSFGRDNFHDPFAGCNPKMLNFGEPSAQVQKQRIALRSSRTPPPRRPSRGYAQIHSGARALTPPPTGRSTWSPNHRPSTQIDSNTARTLTTPSSPHKSPGTVASPQKSPGTGRSGHVEWK